MARPRINDSTLLIEMTENYFVNIACGDVNKLKFSLLAEYFTSCGVEVKAHNLRRDNVLIEYIEQLKASNISISAATEVGYKTLDIDELVRNCHDIKGLRKSLEEIDSYWRKVYEQAQKVNVSDKSLHKKNESLIAEKQELEAKIAALNANNTDITADNVRLKKENTYLKSQVKKYLYPSIANELLRKMRLPAAANEAVKSIAFEDFIEGNRPQAFEGEQRAIKRKLSREEELLAAMREQIDS